MSHISHFNVVGLIQMPLNIAIYIIISSELQLTVNNIPVNEYIAQKFDIPSNLETKHDTNPLQRYAHRCPTFIDVI